MRIVKLVIAIGILAGVVTVGMSSGENNKADAGPALAQAPDPALNQMAVFRRPRGQQDALPVLAARSLAAKPVSFGENPALSRVVRLPSGSRYLVPGRGVVNFMTAWGSGGAAAISDVVSGQVVVTEVCSGNLRSGQFRVVGLLPDDASDAGVILRNGKRIDLSVIDNAYELVLSPATADELPAKVVFRIGTARQEVPVPGADDEILTLRCAGQ